MNTNITLEKIADWANSSSAYLSQRTEYARGYITAKEIVCEMLNSRPYFIDYVCPKDSYGNQSFYYQLIRTSDSAILYANGDLDNVFLHCFHHGISKDEIILK